MEIVYCLELNAKIIRTARLFAYKLHVCYSLTYLRLDGSVEPEKRFEIVKAFNSDPTIDALLLTTHGRLFLKFLEKLIQLGSH